MFHPHLLKMAHGWWFQPLWKILVRFDHHPVPIGENKKTTVPVTTNQTLWLWLTVCHGKSPFFISFHGFQAARRSPGLRPGQGIFMKIATGKLYHSSHGIKICYIYIYIVNWHQSVIPIFLTNIDLYWPYHWDSLGLLTVYRHCQLTNISEWVPHFSPCLLIK